MRKSSLMLGISLIIFACFQLSARESNIIRRPSFSPDGSAIAFSWQGTSDSNCRNLSEVKVEVNNDNRFDNRLYKTYNDEVNDFAVSPNGRLNAFVICVDIFVTRNHKEDEYTVNITKNSSRETDPVWINDSTLIYLSDRDNQYDIYLAKSNNGNETNLLKSLQFKELQITQTEENESEILLSPDGEKIAFVRGLGNLIVADISKN